MFDLTSICRPYLNARSKKLSRHADDLEHTQRQVLAKLLAEARSTEIGRRYSFDSVRSVEQYVERVPLRPYEDIRNDVMRMVMGERNVLWRGRCRRFAQSSGTSDGRSKYIPVTDASLKQNHYAGSADALAEYLHLYPDSRILGGQSFILGGSFATTLTDLPVGTKVGDLSAHLIDKMPCLANKLRIPSRKEVGLMSDWKRKIPALVKAAEKADIRSLSGVPSWFLIVLREVLNAVGAENIHDVWPNLEVFFHGGINFEPYREQYRQITNPDKIRYLETYNASEGFFAVQDLHESGAMLLLPNVGVFYEFDPMNGNPLLKAWEVEQGHVYALVITAANGLWRYPIGDTVRIESTSPLRISIAGRTKLYINAFGEEVMVHNADAALVAACAATNCEVSDYTAAPLFAENGRRGHHQWLIEFAREPQSLEEFADELDRCLCAENSDYAAKRQGSIFLDRLEVVALKPGTFNQWLAATGKLGGQRKVPRLCPDRHIVDAILATNPIDK